MKWIWVFLLVFAIGCAGSDGADGQNGSDGEQGPAGERGPAGEQGAMGAMGAMGVQGEQGAMGAMGEAGTAGAEGMVGPQGPPGEPAPKPGFEATPPQVGTLRLSFPMANIDVTLNVVRFETGLQQVINLGSPTGGAGAGRVEIKEFAADVLFEEEIVNLHPAIAQGAQATTVEFTPTGAAAPLFTSALAVILELKPTSDRTANQQFTFTIKLGLGNLVMTRGAFSTAMDRVSNLPTCVSTPCGCSGTITPLEYIHTGGLPLQLQPTQVAVDSFDLGWENTIDLGSSSGGAGAGRLKDSGTTIVAPLSDATLCEFAALVYSPPNLSGTKLHYANPLSTTGNLLFDYTLEGACITAYSDLTIFSDDNGDIKTRSTMAMGAQQITGRTFDATGQELSSTTTNWNFIANSTSTSCF